MRDSKRIKRVLNEIERIWNNNRSLRLSQLIVNATENKDIFYFEDDDLLNYLKQYNEKYGEKI